MKRRGWVNQNFFLTIVSSQHNIKNTFIDQRSPRPLEVNVLNLRMQGGGSKFFLGEKKSGPFQNTIVGIHSVTEGLHDLRQ